MIGEAQDCRHAFSVDTVCERCGIALSDYTRRLRLRVLDLESKVTWWQEQHGKQEARADNADFTCSEAQHTVQDFAAEIRMLREAGALVNEAFEQRLFLRDISHDHEPGWALRLAPYLAALARLARA